MKNLSSKENFIGYFLKEQGLPENNYNLSILAGDGSARLFQRLEPVNTELTFVFMENPPENDFFKKENLAYLKIGNHMISKGLPLPGILKHDLDSGYFILEDMGDTLLQEKVLSGIERDKIYEDVIEALLRLQIDGKEDFDTAWCCQTSFYDASLMREKEAWYFRDSFLRDYAKIKIDFSSLNEPFEYIISMAEKADKYYLLHRDFQSRNIMCSKKGIAILDWQGARLGPLAYDLASLVFDPYVDLPEKERSHLIDIYALSLNELKPDACESFKRYFLYIAAMRILQALGAYSFLSLKQGKTYFKKYIPVALKILGDLLDEIADRRLLPLVDIVRELSS